MSASESSSASVVDQCILKLNTRLQGVIKRKRDLLLPSHFTLYQLHKVLQVSYDLCDRHLHRYNFEQDPAVFIRPRYPRREDYYDNYEEYEEDYREASRQLRAFTEEEERVRNKVTIIPHSHVNCIACILEGKQQPRRCKLRSTLPSHL